MQSQHKPVLKNAAPLKVAVDTCVILAAAGVHGADKARKAQAALEHAKSNGQIVLSHPCMMEWFLIASRAAITAQASSPSAAWSIASVLKRTGQMFAPTEKVEICSDPEDNKWLALTQAAKANVLLTEDYGLLSLHSHAGTQIMRVSEYLKSYVHCAAQQFKGIALKSVPAPHDAAYGRRRAQLLGQHKKARP